QGSVEGGVGSIIPAFGDFVVRGNLVVGVIMFAILITIQFIVIAAGSGRVAEVAARFTLDAMPGKQMGIDAELHAGAITAAVARERRANVQKEAEFFGAMDGAGKFVKGDAIAALVIVVLNLVGGVAVGTIYDGLSPQEAINTFALLSIGNALVTTLPAFLMSISMGMLVTRVAADGSLGSDLGTQLLRRPEVLRSAALLAFGLALVPVLPHPLFIAFGLAALLAAQLSMRRNQRLVADTRAQEATQRKADRRRPEAAFGSVGVDTIAIDLGRDLAPFFTASNAEAIIERVVESRRMVAREMGLVLAGVNISDDATREASSYEIRFRGEVVGSGHLRTDLLMAIGEQAALAALDGEEGRDPVYGFPVKWIDPKDRDFAMSVGTLVFDPISVLVSHLTECARHRAALLFGRQEMQTLLEHLRTSVPAIVKEVGTDALPFGAVHKAFVHLMRERVWPRNPVSALEAMIDASTFSRDPRDLADAARKILVPPLLYARKLRELPALMFDPEFESRIASDWLGSDGAAPDPRIALHIRERVERYAKSLPGGQAYVVCTSPFRRHLSDLLEKFGVRAEVFGFGELPRDVSVRPAEIVTEPHPTLAVAG
ncbi:MAG: FHIPEP family type III secretion protein, partial [Candidatus Eremiobacteraeota bacterium]|nr:FHIPEP family type III secretion protein [Candidatus Eremiobacteraeota bacterium]